MTPEIIAHNRAIRAAYSKRWRLEHPGYRRHMTNPQKMAAAAYAREHRRLFRVSHPLLVRAKQSEEQRKIKQKECCRAWRVRHPHYKSPNPRKRDPASKRRLSLAYYYRSKSRPDRVMKYRLHARMNMAIKKAKSNKAYNTEHLLGCNIQSFLQYIARLFKPGMDWNNRRLWHIDHILPCASFDLTNPSEQIKCFHYTNLQPLWAMDNLIKGDR